MARQTLQQIFEAVRKAKKNVDKMVILRANHSPQLFYTLWVAYSPKVKWLLPEGLPPFKAHKGRPGSEPSDLSRELRRFYLFLDGGAPNLTQLRREKLFQEVLEGLSEGEVKILQAIKDHTFAKDYHLSEKLLNETFPGLLDAPFTLKFIR